MGDRYLRTIFNFLGIKDYTTISAETLDVDGNDVDALIKDAMNKANEIAVNY